MVKSPKVEKEVVKSPKMAGMWIFEVLEVFEGFEDLYGFYIAPTPAPKLETTQKEKQKKQSESVIGIIEDEWNMELSRLKDSG